MPWFKYQVGSIDKPFIFDLINTFKADGYLIYFGCVDIIADNFDVYNPGFCRLPVKFIAKKLQVSSKKVQKVLTYCSNNEKKIKELPYIRATFDTPTKGMVELECSKLTELADDYTRKKLAGLYGDCPENSGDCPENISRDKDIDKDKEVDKEIQQISDEIYTFTNNAIEKISNYGGNLAPKVTTSLTENSADTIDKLIRLDNFTLDYIQDVLEWGMNDEFWKSNLYSLAALRKKGKNGLTKFQNVANGYERENNKTNKNKKAAEDFING